jgi:macrolide-specific efflux system membrane fusion protein
MRNIRATAIGCVILLLADCSPATTTAAIPTVVLQPNPVGATGGVTASGVIVPAHEAELGFPLTGVVQQVFVQAGDKVSAGQALAKLDTSVLEAQAKEADAIVRAEQIHYTYLRRTGTDQEHLDSALADVARVQASLDAANATLAQATLVAPFAGTIASVDTVPYETVIPGQIVITMGDLTSFHVETTDLSERDAPKVQVGQTARVTVPALGQDYTGKVTDVSRISSTVGGDVVYKVTIGFDTQPAGLMWGMSTNVDISTGS